MSDLSAWSPTAASNNSAAPNGWPEGQLPSSVNDCGREMMGALRRWYEDAQWIDIGHVPTFVSATSFTIPTDVTATYETNRRIKMYGTTMGTLYGTISSSSYAAPNTTVNVMMDSGALTSNLSRVYISALTPTNSAIPAAAAPLLGTATFSAAGEMTAGTVPPARRSFKGAYAYNASAQSIPNLTSTTVQLNTEIYDTDTFHDNATNNTRLTIPSGVSYVRVIGHASFAANATGHRTATLLKNAGALTPNVNAFVQATNSAIYGTSIEFISPVLSVIAGDYFELSVTQTSGGALDVSGYLALEVVN